MFDIFDFDFPTAHCTPPIKQSSQHTDLETSLSEYGWLITNVQGRLLLGRGSFRFVSGDDPTNAVIASHNLSVGRQAYRPSVRTPIALSTPDSSFRVTIEGGCELPLTDRARGDSTPRFLR